MLKLTSINHTKLTIIVLHYHLLYNTLLSLYRTSIFLLLSSKIVFKNNTAAIFRHILARIVRRCCISPGFSSFRSGLRSFDPWAGFQQSFLSLIFSASNFFALGLYLGFVVMVTYGLGRASVWEKKY